MAGLLSEIRDNNYIQPNRQFNIRGDVKFIERETKFTKIVLSVFDYYYTNGQPDEITIWFKGNPKRIADKAIQPKCTVSIMGDIVIKDKNLFFSGKIIEVFKPVEYITNGNTKNVDPNSVNYDKAW